MVLPSRLLMVARTPVDVLEGEWRAVGMEEQPRPVILDPHRRAHVPKLLHLVSIQEAKSPWIFCREDISASTVNIPLKMDGGKFSWTEILDDLYCRGIKSVMIEGGATVINDVLSQRIADVVIITIAPVFLGRDGVGILPTLQEEWLHDVQTFPVGKDIVIAGRLQQT
jgi:2,5-diamino-6-(ribosylamino)-4(3H)-pyrimidinone 5'-phosphate reductase